jgi:hypothetical protein
LNFLCGFTLNPACTEPGRAQPLALLVHAAQQQAHVVAGLARVQQLAEHLHARAHRLLTLLPMPTISSSSPTFTTPRSIRPVTTVPRPEIENTSSTGIRNGLSDRTLGLRDVLVHRLHQLENRTPLLLRPDWTAASRAEPLMIGISSPGNS